MVRVWNHCVDFRLMLFRTLTHTAPSGSTPALQTLQHHGMQSARDQPPRNTKGKEGITYPSSLEILTLSLKFESVWVVHTISDLLVINALFCLSVSGFEDNLFLFG